MAYSQKSSSTTGYFKEKIRYYPLNFSGLFKIDGIGVKLYQKMRTSKFCKLHTWQSLIFKKIFNGIIKMGHRLPLFRLTYFEQALQNNYPQHPFASLLVFAF